MILVAGRTIYSVTMLFAKAALFLLYYRIFSLDHWTKIAIYVGLSITFLLYITTGVANLALCTPRRNENWNSNQRCRRAGVLDPVQGAFGLVSDLYIFILPLPTLSRLQMLHKKRTGVTAVFLTGLM